MKKNSIRLCGAFSILASVSSIMFAEPPTLFYDYTTPYSGASALTVYNDGDTAVKISELEFSLNASLTGTPYGTLWGYNSHIDKKQNEDGIDTDYSIHENPAVVIAAHQSATITYSVTDLKGPFTPHNILVGPKQLLAYVQVNTTNTPVNITLKNTCKGEACQDPGHGKRIMGYYPDWAYWRSPKFLASQIPFTKVNAVNYAFSIFDQDGKISLYDQESDAVNLPIISQARKQYPYLNASLSFGGWSWASTPAGWQCSAGAGPAACFAKLTSNPTAMAKFIGDAVQGMKQMGFNGIDIDWEYPEKQDADHFVLLLQGLRSALDKQAKQDNTYYYLTIATPAGIDKINNLTNIQWKLVTAAVDYVDVMTYDFHGSWDESSDFMSAMKLDPEHDQTALDPILGKYNLTDAIKAYQDRGVPNNKIVVGIPMYGRMSNIQSIDPTKEGLYQTITGTPQGEWDNPQSGFTGMVDYHCIIDPSTCGNNSYQLPALTLVNPLQDKLGQYALTPWGYSANKFITYDDAASATRKAQWIKQNGFAGVMLWDFSGDFKSDHPLSIVANIQQVF